MTLFQARFIQYLTLVGCSIRATAGNYYARYDGDGIQHKKRIDYDGWGGNQLDGMFLRERAIDVLKARGVDPVIGVYDNNIGYEDDSYEKFRMKQKNRIQT